MSAIRTAAIGLLTLLVGLSALAQELQYLPFKKAISGLQAKEAQGVKQVFDSYKVLDLKASGLTEVEGWMGRLNQRLTQAIERRGDAYPHYRLYLIASEAPDAFVFKSQPPGHKVYRGHVFLSTGLIHEMLQNMGAEIDTATPEQIDRLLNGIQGVLAHEFTHPKQDELVKWEWRKEQGKSRQSHGQTDELATDLMAMRTLKDAGLPPENILQGLELLFGPEAERGNYTERTIKAVLSSHPQDNLRLNMVRGGLTKMRLEEGKAIPRPIEYDLEKLQDDLARSQIFATSVGKISFEIDPLPGSRFVNILTHLKETLRKPGPARSNPFKTYLDHLTLLIEEEKTRGPLSDAEMTQFLDFMDYMLVQGRSDTGSNGGDALGQRKVQKLLNQIRAFKDERFKKWFDSKWSGDFWQLLNPKIGGIPHGIGSLIGTLPRESLDIVFKRANVEIVKLDPPGQMTQLILLWRAQDAISVPPDQEAATLSQILALAESNLPARQVLMRFPFLSKSTVSSTQFGEKFQRYKKTHPKQTEELANIYGRFAKRVLESPHLLEALGPVVFTSDGRIRHHMTRALVWSMDSGLQHQEIGETYPARPTQTIQWMLDQIAKAEDSETLFKWVGYLLPSDYWSFKHEDGIRLAEGIIDAFFKIPPPNDPAHHALTLVNWLSNRTEVQNKVGTYLFKKLMATTGKTSVEVWASYPWMDLGFRGQVNRSIEFAQVLRTQQIFTDRQVGDLTLKYLIYEDARNIGYDLHFVNRRAMYQLWETERGKGVSGTPFLKKVVAQFETSRFKDVTGEAGRPYSNLMPFVETSKDAGVQHLPSYARSLSYIAPVIEADFRREVGLDQKMSPDDPQYAEIFKKNWDSILQTYRLIFNPDGVTLPNELKHLVEYRALDEFGPSFSRLIPNQGLSVEQRLELWKTMAAKRQNRYTDEVFQRHILPHIKSDELKESEGQFILDHGLVFSERLKMELFAPLQEARVNALAQKRGEITDPQISALTDDLLRAVPDTSRFKDEYLESLAWRLELNDKQLAKFIEPLKSFNYTSIDLQALNLLSTLSVLIEKLSVKEKLRFLQYIQEPKGELFQTLPTLRKSFESLVRGNNSNENLKRDFLEKAEAFIRDANESQRLVLNEMLVGTRTHGLWYQGDAIREQLFKMAGLDAERKELFLSYQKSMPSHERTVALSYLLAAKSNEESGGPNLLRILELHKTPGYKFAQMASILSIFGEAQSRELAKAKDRSDPISRAEAYAQLKEVYDPTLYSRIRRIKTLAGSGGIKQVLIVEFDDGTTEAVYLKRKFLTETIASTLDVVEYFTQDLRKNPNYSSKYEYDYYLQSLRAQLNQESDFLRELELSKLMASKYDKVSGRGGWKFKSVPPSTVRPQTEDVLHFTAIQSAKSFDSLSSEDKHLVSSLIVDTELDFLLGHGVFDADRHLGNYLFDPVAKVIYPIDFSQVHQLQKTTALKLGDPYHLAQMLRGLSEEDPARGAQLLSEAFVAVAENRANVSAEQKARVGKEIESILKSSTTIRDRLTAILGALTREKIHLPAKYTLGIFKGLMIVTNEDYARYVEPASIQKRLKRFVQKELVVSTPARCLRSILERL